jgi:hypothetical protein
MATSSDPETDPETFNLFIFIAAVQHIRCTATFLLLQLRRGFWLQGQILCTQ